MNIWIIYDIKTYKQNNFNKLESKIYAKAYGQSVKYYVSEKFELLEDKFLKYKNNSVTIFPDVAVFLSGYEFMNKFEKAGSRVININNLLSLGINFETNNQIDLQKILLYIHQNFFNYKNIINMVKQNRGLSQGFVTIAGKGSVLVSAPHAVPQFRAGNYKPRDLHTDKLAYAIATTTKCHAIVRTKNLGSELVDDDPNFEPTCNYKTEVLKLIKKHNIKLVVDLHTLAKHRFLGIYLCTDGLTNLDGNKQLYNLFRTTLNKEFDVETDIEGYLADGNTISNFVDNFSTADAMQLEINSALLSDKNTFNKVLNSICEIIDAFNKTPH